MKESDLKALPSLTIPIGRIRLSKDEDENLRIYDILRKKFINLTPEEFVRQNFVHWLVDSLGYPESLMANEIEIKLNDTRRRCDTVVFDRNFNPLVVIEYKAPGVEISQNTFDQIVRYNMIMKAKYLIVSNGIQNYCCVIDYNRGTYNFIPRIPNYNEAVGMPAEN